MVLFNYATRELTAKIVYYGPGLCGKTTNLQFIHENLPGQVKGKMLSLATKTDRTLFFDFLPLDLGEIRGMKTRVQLYTVPGQVFYNETRKLVLKGVDGVVFVADSQQDMLSPNVEAFKNLEQNLKGHGIALAELPHVIQFNKRDLPKLSSLDEINAGVNKYNAPFYESVATTGIGVKDTLNAITKLVLLHLTKKYGAVTSSTAKSKPKGAAVPAAVATPTAAPPAASAAPTIPQAAAAASAPAPAPAAAAAAPSPVEPATPVVAAGPPAKASGPTFDETEIDDLVNEVQAAGADVAIDLPAVTPPQPAAEVTSPVVESTVLTEVQVATEVTLTEALDDQELFNDPGLEVARLAAGEARDVIIPVEIGTRRFKLSLRLRLDDVV